MLGIVLSRADEASVHVGQRLRDLADWRIVRDDARPDGQGGGDTYRLPGAPVELRTFDALHLDLEGVDRAFDGGADLIAVASRHAGETGALLAAHHTGNFAGADYGGDPRSFARAAPNAQKAALRALAAEAPEGYEVGVECTHHGPTGVDTPFLFVELGSGREQWTDPEGAQAVASALLSLRGIDPDRERTLVGFGGGHYAPRFERVLRETGWAVGHVAADWAIDAMVEGENDGQSVDPAVIARAIERSGPGDGPGYALLEGAYPSVRAAVEEAGGRVVTETWVREADGVALGLVERLENAVGPIDEGLRLGALAEGAEAGVGFETHTLPDALLAECNGIDRDRTLAAVRRRALAVGTEEGATRLATPVVLPVGSDGAADGHYAAVVEALVGVLARKYDRVERSDGVVLARERAFVPERARELGVEEGPAFGRLSNGQTVEVNGDTVPPEAVHEDRTRRFPVR